MSKDARFWRNVTLIAIVHVALIAGLIRWCVEARSSSDAQSIVWLSGAEDLAAEEPDSGESAQPVKVSTPPPELKPDEAEKEQPLLTPAKSEIESDEIGRSKENRRRRREKKDRENRSIERGIFISDRHRENRFSGQRWTRGRREQRIGIRLVWQYAP